MLIRKLKRHNKMLFVIVVLGIVLFMLVSKVITLQEKQKRIEASFRDAVDMIEICRSFAFETDRRDVVDEENADSKIDELIAAKGKRCSMDGFQADWEYKLEELFGSQD